MAGFKPELETCPCCGSTGNCIRHASYDRFAIDFQGGKPVDNRITILRVICGSCGHTHAVLIDGLIPYNSYSIFFVLWALALYFSDISTVAAVCDRFGIPPTTLYRWKNAYLDHKELWLGVLNDASISEADFIRILRRFPSFSDFLRKFFQSYGRSFLQTHAETARSRQT